MVESIIQGLMASGKYKLLYGLKEAAEVLDCGVNVVPKMIERGEIGFYQNPFKTNEKQITIFEIVEHILSNTRQKKINQGDRS
jgi:hypothetical protein